MVTVESWSVERELKFEADSLRVEDLPGEPIVERLFTSVYFDTEDGSLLSAGITLRRRTEEGHALWQLKLPGSDGRLELEEAGGPTGPPEALAALLRARLRGRSLVPLATLRTRRSGRVFDHARVTLDRVDVLEDSRTVARFSEVEAELTDASVELGAIKRRLKKVGARATDGRSKLQRALEALEVTRPSRELAKPSAPAIDLLRSYLAEQLDELTAHDPAVRVGSDPEDVHDMRVAVRRLRTALKTAKPMLDPVWVDELRSELGWLADALAPVRDLDVLIEYLEQEIATLDAGDAVSGQHLLSPLRERRRYADEKLRQTLDSNRYLSLLERIEAGSQAPPTLRADLDFDKRARNQYRKLKRQVASLGDQPSSAALHRTRIRAKRVRYATELAAGNDNGHRKALIKALKTLQDTLGAHQDAAFADHELRSLNNLVHTPEAQLVIGRLMERQHRRRAVARAAFRGDWKRVRRKRP